MASPLSNIFFWRKSKREKTLFSSTYSLLLPPRDEADVQKSTVNGVERVKEKVDSCAKEPGLQATCSRVKTLCRTDNVDIVLIHEEGYGEKGTNEKKEETYTSFRRRRGSKLGLVRVCGKWMRTVFYMHAVAEASKSKEKNPILNRYAH